MLRTYVVVIEAVNDQCGALDVFSVESVVTDSPVTFAAYAVKVCAVVAVELDLFVLHFCQILAVGFLDYNKFSAVVHVGFDYGKRIVTAEENAVNFYGGNTLDRFVVVEGEKKYLTEISLGSTRPLFEGSTLCDPYGAGVDAISSDGGYAAGIRGEVLTVLALETSNFSPTEKKEIRLSERGLSKAQVLRFINERHLWLSCEKEGKARGYLCDASTGELIELPLLPEGYETERLSRVWHQGGLRENEETKAWEIPFFHAVTGREILLSLSREEFSSVELLALSPNGEYAAVKCEREGQEVYGSYRFADGSLTLFEGRPLRVDFASEQVMMLQTDAGYRAVRIVH